MKDLLKKISIPEEAHDIVLSIYEKLCADKDLKADVDKAVYGYFEKGRDFGIEDYIKDLAAKLGENHYTVYLVFLMECVIKIKPFYDEKGISEEIYWDTMTDISYKVIECKKLHGVYGVDVFAWYHVIFGMYTFKLGRLEYAEGELIYDSYKDYAVKGDRVYNMHIPSAGPMTPELVLDSLKRAYKFFRCEKYLIVHCGSWLIYPPYVREVFVPGSNMCKFYEMFDIVEEVTTGRSAIHRWVYYKPNENTPENEIPRDTTLQRNFVKYFSEGKPSGVGKGIIVFDGEKIVNK
ncbi:MAG: hypothetical protein E7583_04470 [Ruminococcaceae bacterium]|nr:hypothetical protein [Oscillospiraceae bacterium]